MQMRHLQLKNFRRFDQIEIEFRGGLNLVKGPNEAGKSTIQEAIIVGFLDRPTGKQSERRFQKWGQDRLYEIELTYLSTEGEAITLAKDFERKTHRVSVSGEVDETRAELEAAVSSAIGTLSQDLFESTVCIRQDAMTEMEEGAEEISRQLQDIVIGGEGVVDQAIDQLSSRVAEYERGWKTSAPVHPGPIKQLQDRIAQYELEIDRMMPEIKRKEGAIDELQGLSDRLEDIQRELDLQKDLHETHVKKRELRTTLDDRRQREQELEGRIAKLREVSTLKEEKRARLDEFSQITSMDGKKKQAIQEAYEEERARRIELQDREAQFIDLRDEWKAAPHLPERKRWVTAMLLGIGSLVGLWGLLMLLFPGRMMFSQVGPLVTIFGLVLALAGGFQMRRDRSASRASIEVDRGPLAEARKRLRAGEGAAEEARKRLREMLASIGYDSWEVYRSDWDKALNFQNELVALESTLEALIASGGDVEALELERENASRERRDAQEQLAELEAYGELSPVEFQRTVNKIEQLQREKLEVKEAILRLEAVGEAGGSTIGDLHRLNELRVADERRLEHALNRHRVLRITLEGMRKAREHTLNTARDALEPRLSEYLGHVTGGRYDQVEVDEELRLQVLHPSKSESPIEMDELSQGTRDQVYLSARLALCDLIFGEARPPLLMDDPFVKFDPQRRDAALQLCKQLATDRQIILFTCHSGYDAYADHVIDLQI